jgi:hypothetical protein
MASMERDVMTVFKILAGFNWNYIFIIIFSITIICYIKVFCLKMHFRRVEIHQINTMLDS